ncbi:MAG: efflux transporter outer membrane subunit [Puniceicoccales bacterium]|jgi:multidrug efflux system outer membrane protein|nr:efflux transporter outer membrane subunit [Puniceicoccales bacterium]
MTHLRTKPLALLLASLAILPACTMAPDYEQPESPVAESWPSGEISSNPEASAAEIPWTEFFGDPRLKALIACGLENNRDLRTAILRVEQVRAQYRIEASALWPSVSGNADMSRGRTPADLSPSGRSVTSSQYSLGGMIPAYEIDLFGRIRSLKDAALETWLAAEETRRATQLAFVATLATQYLTERSTNEQLILGQQTLELVEKSHALTKAKYDEGVGDALELRMAEAQVANARTNIAEYTRLHEQAQNGLVFLIGTQLPDDLPPPLSLGEQNLIVDIPAGLPSDLLQRRPDILQAEHTLRSSNANIGAARAAFFPQITLTAFGGTSSADLDGLFKAGSGTWSFAPQITVPIFTAGRNMAALDIAKIQKRMDIAAYEKAIQSAFREVADGLSARAAYDNQLIAQRDQVDAQQARFDLSNLRWKAGSDSYLPVLTAQQDLFSAQQGLIRSQAAHLISLVDLYKALGGGWGEDGDQGRVTMHAKQETPTTPSMS